MARLRINQGLNLTLDATSTDFQVKSLAGPNNDKLLINGRNFGVEVRVDEDNTGGDLFRVTQGPNGAKTLFSVDSGGYTRVDGPGLGVGGTNYVYNTYTPFQIPGADANAKWLIVKDTSSGAGVISFNNTKDADGNILGSLVWTREGGQSDGHRQVAGIVAVQSGTGAIAGSELRFYTKASSGPRQAMVIDRNGNVGIGTTSPSYKLDVSGDVRWTGTLQGGTVPWVRLSGYPSVNAGTGLTGGGSLSGNVTLNLSPDFIKDFPTGTPSAGDFALIGPSSGSTSYKVPIGPGVGRIPFHAGDGRGVELKGERSVVHLAGEFSMAVKGGRWFRLFQITLSNFLGATGEIWFGQANDVGFLSSRLSLKL